MNRNIQKFINDIKRNGTQYNTKSKFYKLKRAQEDYLIKVIRSSIGNNMYRAVLKGDTVPPNRVVNNMRRANAKRWNQQRKNLHRNSFVTTKHVKIPRTVWWP